MLAVILISLELGQQYNKCKGLCFSDAVRRKHFQLAGDDDDDAGGGNEAEAVSRPCTVCSASPAASG